MLFTTAGITFVRDSATPAQRALEMQNRAQPGRVGFEKEVLDPAPYARIAPPSDPVVIMIEGHLMRRAPL
jgi:hypothetical protein